MSTILEQAETQIATYFGGVYDANTRSWRNAAGAGTPTNIPNVGTLRTMFVKRYPDSDHTYGLGNGAKVGGYALVHIERQQRSVYTTGKGQRLKRAAFTVTMYLLWLSRAAHIEDAQAVIKATSDAVTSLIDADRTLGSGTTGVFANGPGAGEDSQGVVIDYGEPVTANGVTRATTAVTFTAVAQEWA